jgi:hypothetical protein
VATKQRTAKSADSVILDVLAYEFAADDRTEAERKIRRRLRYHGVGPYRQERIDLLRRLKDQVQREVRHGEGSRYFAESHGEYAAMEDFDVQRMTQDLARSFPEIPGDDIAAFVPFAVYLYHLR